MSIAEKFEVIADEVYEKGKEKEHNDFWDEFLSNDYRHFSYGFAGEGWTDKNFRPNQDIIPRRNANYMFAQSLITNLEALIQRQGIVFDLSKAQRVDSMFSYCEKLTLLPVLNFSKATAYTFQQTFYYCTNLHTIRKLILPVENVNRTNLYLNTFIGCSSLANIEVEGNIVQTISFADSPLTVKSIKSIISCLKDYSQSEPQYTITFNDNCWNELEASGSAPDGDTWKNYVIKRGWLIG